MDDRKPQEDAEREGRSGGGSKAQGGQVRDDTEQGSSSSDNQESQNQQSIKYQNIAANADIAHLDPSIVAYKHCGEEHRATSKAELQKNLLDLLRSGKSQATEQHINEESNDIKGILSGGNGRSYDEITHSDGAANHGSSDAGQPTPTTMPVVLQDLSVQSQAIGKPVAIDMDGHGSVMPTTGQAVANALAPSHQPAPGTTHRTADGKPYPRNRSCPCGSRHKCKKCCGQTIVVEEVSNDVAESPTEESSDPSGKPSPTANSYSFSNHGESPISSVGSSAGVNRHEIPLTQPESCVVKLESPMAMVDEPRSDDVGPVVGKVGSAPGIENEEDRDNMSEVDSVSETDSEEDLEESDSDMSEDNDEDSGEDDGEADNDGGSNDEEEADEEEEVEIDEGGFNMHDICVALGNGTLDQERLDRLHRGFIRLMEWQMGVW